MAGLIGLILEWYFTLLLLLFYFLIRCVLLIIRVFVLYRCRPLWISLIVCLICFLLAAVLYQINSEVASLASLGFWQLVITAKVVEVTNSDVLMKEPETLVGSVLHTDWFRLEP